MVSVNTKTTHEYNGFTNLINKITSNEKVNKVAMHALSAFVAICLAATIVGIIAFSAALPITLALIVYGVLAIGLCAVVLKVMQIASRTNKQEGV